ncbi:MAG: DNA polymerase Y family protein [Reinekea sp.]
MLWLYIHFPQLALETEFLGDQRPLPQLLLKPGQQTVMQCNELAMTQGVRVGMNKKTAFCLLADCAIAEYDPHKEKQTLQQMATHCYRHAAQITLQPPCGLLLEIGSMLTVFNGLETYWEALQQQLQRIGCHSLCSTGHTANAARLLAEAGLGLCSDDKTAHQQALNQLSVNQLGLDNGINRQLTSMGVLNYAQLSALPRRELGFRFGLKLVEQLDKLIQDKQTGSHFKLPPRFQQTMNLNYEAEHAAGLLFPLRRCLLNLESYLHNRQLQCEKLLIKLEHRDGRASLLTIPSVHGSYRQADWLALLQTQLEQTRLINPVTALTLRAKDFLPFKGQSDDFLGERFPEADINTMQSLLIARLGDSQVQKLSVMHDPRPEVASGVINSQTSRHTLNARQWPAGLRQTAKAIDINRYQIIQGPERIEGGWWDAQPVRRDYYIAKYQQSLHWIFRRDDGQWFLHGEFI